MTKKQLLEISKPLNCNIEVAKAFADKRKTQTRRLPKGETGNPRYKVGDILWIREPARIICCTPIDDIARVEYLSDSFVCEYEAYKYYKEIPSWMRDGGGVPNGCTKFMARMFYKVVDFRYEELQHISIDDIIEEGFEPAYRTQGEDRDSGYEWWEDTWNKTAPKGKKWDDNPLIEAYKLERIDYEL